jgi:phosphoserine aminotransferase
MNVQEIFSKRVHNFNAGPATLPLEVLESSASAILEFNQSGMSILEYGHRTPKFTEVMEEARALVRELMQLDGDHEVLFLHGGASTQFMQVPMNLLDERDSAAYADTGVWSHKAIKEAENFGKVEIPCSSRESGYRFIPNDFAVPNDARYFHLTTNNTIYGTQWKKIPRMSVPMVADMSSDIFSRELSFNSFDLLYAGAQKNMGPAGVTLVVINPRILGKIKRKIPAIMDYKNHIREKSMLNTPPVFAVYVSMLNLRWIKEQGGIPAMEMQNKEKAMMLYEEIDRNPLFRGTVNKEDRSFTNVCFVTEDPSLENSFLEFTQTMGIMGIKGHRSVGGFRASLYNALPLNSVKALVRAMQDFNDYKLSNQ